MDQAELRRWLREQLDEAQCELATLAATRKRKQYRWAEEVPQLKTGVTEIESQLRERRHVITFPDMFQKVTETEQRLAQKDREKETGPGEGQDGKP